MKFGRVIRTAIPAGIATLITSFISPGSVRAENVEHLQKLLTTRQCNRCELSNAGLVFANLANADLSGANLSGANLSRANLQGANLRGANLIGASLYGANLVGAQMDGANLTVADLRQSYLMGASINGAILESTLLQGAVGLPPSTGTAAQFYRWALEDERGKNYPAAIDNFTQAIQRQPDLAQAYLGRGIVYLQTNETAAGLSDIKKADELFNAQNNTEGATLTKQLIAELTAPPKKLPKGNGVGIALLNLVGMAMKFLPFSFF